MPVIFLHFCYNIFFPFPPLLRTSAPIPGDVWVTARATRTGRLAILDVDADAETRGGGGGGGGGGPRSAMSPGAFDELSLGGNLYLGGAPAFGSVVRARLPVRDNFRGCVQKVRSMAARLGDLFP